MQDHIGSIQDLPHVRNAGKKGFHYYGENPPLSIYPMLNPDGGYTGSGQNTPGQGVNREWEEGRTPGGTPETDTIRPVIWKGQSGLHTGSIYPTFQKGSIDQDNLPGFYSYT